MGTGIWDQGSGVWDQGSGIRDQGSGIWDQGSGIRDQDINNLLDRQDARMEGQDSFREKNKEERIDC
jgi:hypothetical protein